MTWRLEDFSWMVELNRAYNQKKQKQTTKKPRQVTKLDKDKKMFGTKSEIKGCALDNDVLMLINWCGGLYDGEGFLE